jgi:hypothetical protein
VSKHRVAHVNAAITNGDTPLRSLLNRTNTPVANFPATLRDLSVLPGKRYEILENKFLSLISFSRNVERSPRCLRATSSWRSLTEEESIPRIHWSGHGSIPFSAYTPLMV